MKHSTILKKARRHIKSDKHKFICIALASITDCPWNKFVARIQSTDINKKVLKLKDEVRHKISPHCLVEEYLIEIESKWGYSSYKDPIFNHEAKQKRLEILDEMIAYYKSKGE